MYKDITDIAVIGGGASGLCAAITAARSFCVYGKNGKITVFEALPRVGKKILATGNGRCNLTNADIRPEYFNGDRDFAYKVICGAGENAVEVFFRSIGLYTKTDISGRVYPLSNQAYSVLDALRFETDRLCVNVVTGYKVMSLKAADGGFVINNEYFAKKLIVAAGGKSSPKLGSDGSLYPLLESLGIGLTPVFPALTGLVLEKTYPKALNGTRADCKVEILYKDKVLAEDRGEVQFNETGISGIPVMQVSRAASMILSKKPDERIFAQIDTLPSMSVPMIKSYILERISSNGVLAAENLLTGLMPKALAQVCVKDAGIAGTAEISSLSEYSVEILCRIIKARQYLIKNSFDFSSSQVTGGGADTGGFSPETLESRKVNDLYCCGEILDVDGLCGGYNLHWAWCSGMVCGRAAAS